MCRCANVQMFVMLRDEAYPTDHPGRHLNENIIKLKMAVLDDHIKRINEKLQHLLKNYQLLLKDNERQTKLIVELQEAKEKDAEQVTTLQEQVNILKAAAGQMDEVDKKVFERNISRYIKEIDKCIGILSE